jgi:hypothetical protein
MANHRDPSQPGARPDPGRESAPSLCRPSGPLCDGQRLPDIPKTVNWATTLFVLGAIPLLLVFVDSVFSMPTVAPSADFPAHGDEVMLLFTIGYLMLAVGALNGRRRTRTTITAVTVASHFLMLTITADLGLHLGLIGESDAGGMNVMFLIFAWTVVLSGAGLVLLHTPGSNTYITRSEAYQVYVDQQNASLTSR